MAAIEARNRRIAAILIVLGIVCIAASLVAVVGATGYRFAHENPEQLSVSVVNYENLSDREQRVVDGAIEGEVYHFRTRDKLPGDESTGGLRVIKGDEQYLFTRTTTVHWTGPWGLAAIGLATVGVSLLLASSRRVRHAALDALDAVRGRGAE